MKFELFITKPLNTNTFLVHSKNQAVVIDPGHNYTSAITRKAKELKVEIKLVINTHGHFDHTTGNLELQKETNCKIACGVEDENMLLNPSDLGWNLPFKLQPSKPDVLLKDKDEVKIGSKALRVIKTPGHTLGSICLYSKQDELLFSGDTLFAGTCGRYDLPGGDEKLIVQSLKKLANLPKDTKVLPGHGEFTTIKKELKWIEKL